MTENPPLEQEKAEKIYQLSTLVAGELSLQEVLDRLAEAAVKVTSVKACSIRLLDENSGELQMRSTYGLSEEYRGKGPVTRDDPVIKAAFDGEAVVLDDMRSDDRVRYKDATVKEGLVSQLTVAMQFRAEPIGVLRLYSPKPKRFAEADIALARAVASQCAVAITNAKLYVEAIEGARITEQVRLAGLIQRRMIPARAPVIAGLDIAASYIPCSDVGGDFYDFIRTGRSRITIAMADVIGKGVPAAIMMSMFRAAVRAYSDGWFGSRGIRDIVGKLNMTACEECKSDEFITLFYAVVDREKGTLSYCNCGHEPTLLIRDGRPKELRAGGLVLGVDPGSGYEVETVDLNDGDCLLFYTDGLVDAVDFNGRQWGKKRLVETALRYADGPAERTVGNILRHRRRFVGLASQIDDTSLIAVKLDCRAKPVYMDGTNR
jgi:serine phosphatase RsbU (regulator of sigma subunit)